MNCIQLSHEAPCGLPLQHTFSDGVYVREIFMPKGMIVVGHIHKTRHLNNIVKGKARVWTNGSVIEIKAPYIYESEPNMRKVLYIEEDMIWQTIHATNSKNVNEIEKLIIDKSGFDVNELSDTDLVLLVEGRK